MAKNLLSVFIDESGDFGAYQAHSPFYIVSFVIHEQKISISNDIVCFENYIQTLGYKKHALHTGPLIRRESVYLKDERQTRRKLFNALFNFARKLNIHCVTTTLNKSNCKDQVDMVAKLSKIISDLLKEHDAYFRSFDEIIVYYDNGQIELTKILTAVFSALFSNVVFHNCTPVKYELAQVADLVCTIELLAIKSASNCCSKSEIDFFGGVRNFKRNYLKILRRKQL